jgi:hypothetical protein
MLVLKPRPSLFERACDDARDVIYGNGLYGNGNDILALLVDIYCRRAMRLGCDPQKSLEIFRPWEAPPWVDKK